MLLDCRTDPPLHYRFGKAQSRVGLTQHRRVFGASGVDLTAEAAAGWVSVGPQISGRSSTGIEKIEHFGFVLPVMQL
jgi:hypothetical protein